MRARARYIKQELSRGADPPGAASGRVPFIPRERGGAARGEVCGGVTRARAGESSRALPQQPPCAALERAAAASGAGVRPGAGSAAAEGQPARRSQPWTRRCRATSVPGWTTRRRRRRALEQPLGRRAKLARKPGAVGKASRLDVGAAARRSGGGGGWRWRTRRLLLRPPGPAGMSASAAQRDGAASETSPNAVRLVNGAAETRRRTREEHLALLTGKANEEEVSQGEVVTYNMVAAMNEHLSSSSATNSVRSTTTGTVKDKIKEEGQGKEKSGGGGGAAAAAAAAAAEDSSKVVGILGFPCDFDHMYASMTDGGAPATATSALGVSPLRGNEARHNDLTEVKHLKELLLLHLDLIQQQSEQIVTKDKLLSALRQENETLKLRLERMDRRVNLQKLRSESTENATDNSGACSPPSYIASVNSLPSTSEHQEVSQSDSQSPQYGESFKIRLNTSGGITTVKQELPEKLECKPEQMGESWENKKKRKSDPGPMTSGGKRKRGVSSSSTISNDTSSTVPETLGVKGPSLENLKKSEKKTKSLLKRESFLTTEEHYYTAVGESNYSLTIKDGLSPERASSNLEVPSWRVKVYTSCYTMEGTENLDDEIFNKRHLKLENDERRRKRWDVQRIREQRHIEKLKQRQERQNHHHAACYNINHTGPCPSLAEEESVMTLWPEIDQIQSIQVDNQLPISAFGASVPSFTPSDFSLPWLIHSKSKARRPKRSNSRRRSRR